MQAAASLRHPGIASRGNRNVQPCPIGDEWRNNMSPTKVHGIMATKRFYLPAM